MTLRLSTLIGLSQFVILVCFGIVAGRVLVIDDRGYAQAPVSATGADRMPGLLYWWFRWFVCRMLFQTVPDVSSMLDRERVGREASPSGGVLNRQTVEAPHAKAGGYDANKEIVGHKRNIAVDTDGQSDGRKYLG
jgi:hypothetical protein